MTTVDEIKDRLDIVEVVGTYLKLEKSGRNYRAFCPFHADKKSPSFLVFPNSQRWQCFGACDDGGDIFDFIMRYEGMGFREALADLAGKAGLEIPQFSEREQQELELRRGREMVWDAAVRFWEGALWRETGGKPSEGLTYALSRGWTEETIREARLGFYNGNEVALRTALVARKVDVGSATVRSVLGVPARSLIYPHLRAGKVRYFAARGIGEKRHWNPPRDLAGPRAAYFNAAWRHDAPAVVVVEGQGDGVTLAQWGIAAVALAGASADEGLVRALSGHRTVYLGLDGDATGGEATRKMARALGAMVRVVRWPAHDVNDWLQEGGTAEECRALLKDAPTWLDVLVEQARDAEADEADGALREVFAAMVGLDAFALARYRERVATELGLGLGTVDGFLRAARQEAGLDAEGRPLYTVLGGRVCRRTYDRLGGESLTPLCNFDARIVEDVVEDDGENQERRFTLRGTLAGGAGLSEIEVEAAEFAKMKWVLPMWGARAAVAAGGAAKDHLRMAIQVLSKEIETRYEYSHLGWRRVNGRWVYLSSAGAVGMEGVQVRIINDLERYKLPLSPGSPDEIREAMGASLRFLDTGSYQVTMPLWAAMYLAPLASILPPSFTIWLFGTTGSMKSTATALALCHFGHFAYNTPPASWTGTANALEKKAFLVKDAPLWIDDYTGQSTRQGLNEIKKKADQLLRDWGNRSGRSRMRADLKLRATFVPRGLIISTAEQLPPGQSILSRLFAVEVHPGMMTRGENSPLTRAQLEEAGSYPRAMAGYVTWLAEWWDEVEKRLPARLLEYTERARTEGQHLRMPRNVATMFIGMEMGLKYARSVGALSQDDLEALSQTGWAVLMGIGEQQHQVVAEERPVDMYLSALEQMFAQGTVYLRNKDLPDIVEQVWPEQRTATSELLGWYDDRFWYLLPKAAYNAVWQFYRCSGVVFPDSERGIRVKLLEEKLLLPNEDRFTYRLRIGESLPRVLRIARPDVKGDSLNSAGTSGTAGTLGTGQGDSDSD